MSELIDYSWGACKIVHIFSRTIPLSLGKEKFLTDGLILCFICVFAGSATVRVMRTVLSSLHAGVQGVCVSCTRAVCTSGSKAQTHGAVSSANTTSSWRHTSNPCAR